MIQLDSDAVTVGSVDEVIECVREQVGFALGTWGGQCFDTMRERCETAKLPAQDGIVMFTS